MCGRTKGPSQQKSTWWWDEKVENVIKETRRLWKERKNGCCNKERYIEAKRVTRRQMYEVKSKAETEHFGNLSTSKNCRENACRIAKHIANANKDVIHASRTIRVVSSSLTQKLKAWKEHYEKLLNEEFPWDRNLLQMENPKEGPAPLLEKDAIYTALNKMKDGKAAGVSGIVAEMLKASGEAGLELFIELFNNIVKGRKYQVIGG